jgi:hypothetical protein
MASVPTFSKLYENGSISPLPPVLHNGLTALAFFGFLSFFSTLALLIFLTWRLISWRKTGYNQFVLLIYNLIFADLQQSIAFFINARWVHKNSLEAGTSACFAQGWFISIGQLGTGVWILTIAIHTFAAVVFDYRLTRTRFAIAVMGLWIFVYLMGIIGVAAHPDDIYLRAGGWVSKSHVLLFAADDHSAGSTRNMHLSASGFTTSGFSSRCSAQQSSISPSISSSCDV